MRQFLILLVLLLLAVPSVAAAHGVGDEVATMAKQPARILVQQAHALLVSGKGGEEVELRLDAAALSTDKQGIDAAFLEKGHEAFESGRIRLAISHLEHALADPALREPPQPGTAPSDTTAPVTEEELESDAGRMAIHAESREFRPGYGGQEVGGSIAAVAIALLVALGLLRARSHDRRQRRSPTS